ncbi:Ig-like domain-containing protein [Luethyella okanaganae]|uniref:Ig-like domain-containing protein n=1 Tax=Luethyella okanaganae TaxID=69372 RepID=A0ABW1VEB6_9MICO
MGHFWSWIRVRKSVASVTALAVLVGVPVTIAILHRGFPVTDVDMRARDVWVTNGEALLAGRLNRQIEELNAAVATPSRSADVLQDGDDVFLSDVSLGSVERIHPSFTTLVERIDVPVGAELAFGGETLAVLDSGSGELWTVDAAGELSFDPSTSDPVLKLGKGGHVAVTNDGVVFASSPEKDTLFRIDSLGAEPSAREVRLDGEHQLSAVGDTAVVLDLEKNELIVDGRTSELPAPGIRLQQPGGEAADVLVASADELLMVPLGGGEARRIPTGADGGSSDPAEVSAPVWLNGCAHGAWASTQRYVAACGDGEPRVESIEQPTAGSQLEFRVNRDVIALNNLSNGNVWLVDANMRLVENWDEVTPPEEQDSEEGDEKASKQSFEDTLAERTETNRAPIARDDVFGVRPGKTTVLPVLDNDTDPDGDVLTVIKTGAVAETAGRLDVIDGGRALQFTPSENAVSTVSFRYTVSDGRPGGVAEAQVDVTVRPPSENQAPVAHREGALSVEQGQIVGYNVLTDWRDPDGDDIYLVSAAPSSGDAVRFGPEGFVTFEHKSAQLGVKEVSFVVSDGVETATGVLRVDVQPTGSLNPVGTPDFAETFAGETVLVEPLLNDITPSGAPLALLGVSEVPQEITVVPNTERGTIAVTAGRAGSFVFLYSLGAGPAASVGLIRVDVKEPPAETLPPIAVKDTAYLRAGEPFSLSVLNNDVSPSGKVLAVQSVDTSESGDAISVELLTNTVLRVTAASALTQQLQFTYTISDGVSTSTAGVTVVPVPPLVKHQPPVAVDDAVNVRAGDIVTVPVLENDYHPDSATMTLAPDLVDASAAAGLVFVSGNTVRYQAPREAGVYSASYQVVDAFSESAVATVRFTVVAPNPEGNQPPNPLPLTVRTFADSTVKIDVPLDGIDPDGDSVRLKGVTAVPMHGRIVETASNSVSYESFPGAAGTDTFSYEVEDTGGASAVGTIKVGVIPRPEANQPPNAVDDAIEIKPGRTGSIPVWLNDSDPNGYALTVSKKLPEVDDGIKARVAGNRVIVDAPESEGAFTIRYEITNGHGGSDTAFLQVKVTKDAKPVRPSSIDHVLEAKDIAGKNRVDVDVLEGAQNPGGLLEDLVVTLDGQNAEAGEVLAGGKVRVEPGDTRQVIAYRLTNDIDELSTTSFIVVPPVPNAKDAEEEAAFGPPYLKPLPPQTVRMNGTIDWNLAELVVVPSGRPLIVLSSSAVNGEASLSGTSLGFTAARDYRGPASVSFLVTDGTSANDPKGRSALLTIPVTVGDPNFEDAPPTFTAQNVTIEAGEAPYSVDLRSSTGHPNPALVSQVSYGALSGGGGSVVANLDGATLSLSAPLGVQRGTSVTLSFEVRLKEFTVPGTVTVTVVSSTRPKPQAVPDGEFETRPSTTVTVPVLDNDFNPFAQDGVPLRVVSAELEQDVPGGTATVSVSGSNVVIRTGPSATGTLTAVYRIEDGTKDPERAAQGRITLVIRNVPDAPRAPVAVEGDGAATVTISSTANNNSPITGYTILWGGGQWPVTSEGTYTIGNLANGTSYTFRVVAHNGMGTSAESAPSNAVRPYGVPSAPNGATLTAAQDGSGALSLSWGTPSSDGGRPVSRYEWAFIQGSSASGQTGGQSASASGGNGTTYQFHVRACNARDCGAWTSSGQATPTKPPPAKTITLFRGGPGPISGTTYYNIDLSDWPQGSYPVVLYCNGGQLETAPSISVGADGRGSFRGNSGYCGYPNVWVTVDGKKSDVQDWR